jgi:hypothetical protein
MLSGEARVKPALFFKSLFCRSLLCKSLGELDQDAPVGRVFDFPKSHDEPQPFHDIQIDLIITKQLQQFVAGRIAVFNVHSESSRSESKMASPENDLSELAGILSTAIEKAHQPNPHTSAYILSMAPVEVTEATEAAEEMLRAPQRVSFACRSEQMHATQVAVCTDNDHDASFGRP